ncbi:hypothetical protein FRB94_011814 [Tulasnella sp. JGI-2019a]|nr:hypothetical protein FRB93_002263 [Tulasnella sp. JGI-2019a]KAG9014636.1 hypothetical protein FRB94_011814 [Tulasnella sp. JGI-2019a]
MTHHTSVPRPETCLQIPSVNPRPLQSISPPSNNSPYAILPPGHHDLINKAPFQFNDSYVRTTHIVPAATPRAIGSLEPMVPKDKEARETWLKQTCRAVFEKKLAYNRGDAVEGDNVNTQLFHVLDRYVRSDPRGRSGKRLTLLLIHGNGCPRRIWEPTLRYLLQAGEVIDTQYYIGEVWSFESVNAGDSALLNQGKLGDLFDWGDGSRDQLNFLLRYMPDESSENGSELPGLLKPISEEEAQRRAKNGFQHKKVVAMGHSIGGCGLARAAADTPAVFSSLILLDPTIVPRCLPTMSYDGRFNVFIMGRRSEWPSREIARKELSRYPPNRPWQPEVLDVFIEEALYDTKEGTVRLKVSGFIESVAYMEYQFIAEVWELLPTIDERVALRWVMSGLPPEAWVSVMAGDLDEQELLTQTLWRRPTNASNVRISGIGHAIPQAAPKFLAEDVHLFLTQKYGQVHQFTKL